MARKKTQTGCPCGLPASFEACCGRYLGPDAQPAPTAERLMRSRYVAFALGLEADLLSSWHASARPAELDLAADAGVVKWVGLEIVACRGGQEGDAEGEVEFVARYKVGGKAERLHELSRFCREDGRWYYLSGQLF
ncbi:hypothetical protein CEK28_12265 [Xenophilus sp. AP218F]|nr:YchJ family metal-binding protein [Chromobacterium sp. ASV5]OWY38409.1 hypothetical protein CEK28_12265 [Xenophilus sp. AP218F]